ncbi:glycine decarboxylase subunit P [Tulasnella sp. 418]|nr:glycine decarboxylase subunit P [Tulasnella sp. 418]
MKAAFRKAISSQKRPWNGQSPLIYGSRGLSTSGVVMNRSSKVFASLDTFQDRHVGPNAHEAKKMLETLGYKEMEAFLNDSVPDPIRISADAVSNKSIPSLTESELIQRARALSRQNKAYRSYIGMGYHNAVVPPVIQRNVFESPAWYTPYTPYQPEIAQGRLESLVNFQTMVTSLTGLDISNASLLDEATAAAEAMVMAYSASGQKKRTFFVDSAVAPQTLAVLRTRAKGFGIKLVVGDIVEAVDLDGIWSDLCGVLVQYPDINGDIKDFASITSKVHDNGGLVACATDLLALTMLVPPGEWAGNAAAVLAAADLAGINFRPVDENHVGVTLDESVLPKDLVDIINVFASASGSEQVTLDSIPSSPLSSALPSKFNRTSNFLPHPVFNTHHSETEMLRYIYHLQQKDLSLCHAMIPLGSCTMKLNSTTSMKPLSWKEFSSIHPFAPQDQALGYAEIIKELEADLSTITGFHATSLQPNSGASGEYAGLCVIKAYHESRGEGHRNVCLIPLSAHGTNPASAIMAGMKVVPIKALDDGSLDLHDLETKAQMHKDNLAALMITYPSTFGVFEEGVQKACKIVHDYGGQVYLDGANLNAQVGLTNPAKCGGDVCHLNLHKTFAIPHGGGGPGVGPICVAEHLAPFLPSHPVVPTGGSKALDAMAAAPWGSASILLISWAYIKMLGGQGLSDSSKVALLNANYIAHRLKDHYTVRYKNVRGRVAHELLIDLAEFDKKAGLKVTDFAKRLQDYGFHPPTCSWPIPTAMLIEPTESETLEELDRFCEAMIQIRKEVEDIITGAQPRDNNVLKNAPHPISVIATDAGWNKPYSRQVAAFPLPYLYERKFWPSVSRIDDAYGDLNLMCECPTVEESADH